ncbi:MarR family winged helix-turn-helix transcriptional regulator [Alicyclobacillus fastidiosus]|uniref:MarR family transcriptional regulator n=1 Tax=Alicyclobacillus fastidiosus TaxID=392011 RepID=A0ABV5AD06_9BACL|nr:MarR family transcriptional regulator [Alicyclobacillus fastidiosus]WEH08824.1 MarR family transcriptional regulator [Alicyclobacillus fastidiosus]
MTHTLSPAAGRLEVALRKLGKSIAEPVVNRIEGLTKGQIFMIYHIREAGRCTVSELAGKMDVKPSAITVMLDRLENHGYVSRERDTEDRRVVNVMLTDFAQSVIDNAVDMHNRLVDHHLAQLLPNEVEQLLNTLEKLAEVAATADAGDILDSESR